MSLSFIHQAIILKRLSKPSTLRFCELSESAYPRGDGAVSFSYILYSIIMKRLSKPSSLQLCELSESAHLRGDGAIEVCSDELPANREQQESMEPI